MRLDTKRGFQSKDFVEVRRAMREPFSHFGLDGGKVDDVATAENTHRDRTARSISG